MEWECTGYTGSSVRPFCLNLRGFSMVGFSEPRASGNPLGKISGLLGGKEKKTKHKKV
jgi:hypothetical protein